MHPSVMDFLRQEVNGSDIISKVVLEVGSYNVNGTPRDAIVPLGPASYTGVDSQLGPCVDRVVYADNLVNEFGQERFDVVISTEMLEHVRDWRLIVTQMKAVTKVGGLLIVTTRSPGFPYHPYPEDHWRYTVEDFQKIFFDMDILVLVPDPLPGHPGVFMKARRRVGQLMSVDDLKDIKLGNAR